MSFLLEGGSRFGALRPAWLRPGALGVATTLHLLVLALFLLHAQDPESPYDSYDVALVQDGETAPQSQAEATPEDKMADANSTISQDAAEAQIDEAPKVKTEQLQTPLALEKAKIISPDAIAVAQIDKREDDSDKPTLQRKVEAPDKQEATPDDAPSDKTGETRHVASAAAEAMVAAAAVQRIGAEDGRNAQSAASRATYSAKVKAEIFRHMFYPREARSAGVTGRAIVVFTVGPEGRIVERHIEQSAGSAALDSAALAMLDAVSAPPPPLGRFLGRVPIVFAFGR